MNLYHCSIDLKDGTKALAFANAVELWMDYLKQRGKVQNWRLLRRKLGLAADSCRDFLLEVEVKDLAQLDQAFRALEEKDEEVERLYTNVHALIADTEIGLYRPFPDPNRAERMALI